MADYAVAPDATGFALVLHRADCPQVRVQADCGDPVMTLIGCEREPDRNLPRCRCLKGENDG